VIGFKWQKRKGCCCSIFGASIVGTRCMSRGWLWLCHFLFTNDCWKVKLVWMKIIRCSWMFGVHMVCNISFHIICHWVVGSCMERFKGLLDLFHCCNNNCFKLRNVVLKRLHFCHIARSSCCSWLHCHSWGTGVAVGSQYGVDGKWGVFHQLVGIFIEYFCLAFAWRSIIIGSLHIVVCLKRKLLFRMSAYVWQVAVYTGLSSLHSRSEEGGSISGGIDFRMSCSKFASIQVQASGRLCFVVINRHLSFAVDSILRNHGFQTRCS